MKLYYAPDTCSLSPHIVLRELEIEFELVKVNNKSKLTADGRDFRTINPKGYVAALELDNGQILTEGPAIVQHLADLKPEYGLAPRADSWARVRLQEWLNFTSMETKRKHVPTWLYKLGGRLDKQYGEIVSALSDINAFNAGKKRDKALELVAAWLPEVEKFSKEIGRQQAYIDSLKEQIGQEADYAGRMRDEKYEQELKVQKANQRIFELQRTNEQMGRLLSKIPPEVLEELQRTGRNKSRER